MIKVKRKPNESLTAMLRRFSELIKKEKILDTARQARFFQKKKNKFQRRKETLRRLKNQKKKRYLKKIGVLH